MTSEVKYERVDYKFSLRQFTVDKRLKLRQSYTFFGSWREAKRAYETMFPPSPEPIRTPLTESGKINNPEESEQKQLQFNEVEPPTPFYLAYQAARQESGPAVDLYLEDRKLLKLILRLSVIKDGLSGIAEFGTVSLAALATDRIAQQENGTEILDFTIKEAKQLGVEPQQGFKAMPRIAALSCVWQMIDTALNNPDTEDL